MLPAADAWLTQIPHVQHDAGIRFSDRPYQYQPTANPSLLLLPRLDSALAGEPFLSHQSAYAFIY